MASLKDSRFVHETHNGDRLDAAHILEGQRKITAIYNDNCNKTHNQHMWYCFQRTSSAQ